MNREYEHHLRDTIEHKKHFLDSAWIMARHLIEEHKDKLALNLLRRALVHDNSKLNDAEIRNFVELDVEDKTCDKDWKIPPTDVLEDKAKELIRLHWENNKHHPEHYSSYDKMSELDILEMVCDWHARSIQFGTDLMEFLTFQQEHRFHFSDKLYRKIKNYCEILITLKECGSYEINGC